MAMANPAQVSQTSRFLRERCPGEMGRAIGAVVGDCKDRATGESHMFGAPRKEVVQCKV